MFFYEIKYLVRVDVERFLIRLRRVVDVFEFLLFKVLC